MTDAKLATLALVVYMVVLPLAMGGVAQTGWWKGAVAEVKEAQRQAVMLPD